MVRTTSCFGCTVYFVLFWSKLYFEVQENETETLDIQIVQVANKELSTGTNENVVFDNINQPTSTVTEKNDTTSQTQKRLKSIKTHRTSFGTEYSISF